MRGHNLLPAEITDAGEVNEIMLTACIRDFICRTWKRLLSNAFC